MGQGLWSIVRFLRRRSRREMPQESDGPHQTLQAAGLGWLVHTTGGGGGVGAVRYQLFNSISDWADIAEGGRTANRVFAGTPWRVSRSGFGWASYSNHPASYRVGTRAP